MWVSLRCTHGHHMKNIYTYYVHLIFNTNWLSWPSLQALVRAWSLVSHMIMTCSEVLHVLGTQGTYDASLTCPFSHCLYFIVVHFKCGQTVLFAVWFSVSWSKSSFPTGDDGLFTNMSVWMGCTVYHLGSFCRR